VVFATLNHRRPAGMPSTSSSFMPQHDGFIEVVRTDQVSNDSEIIANEDVRDEHSQQGTLGTRINSPENGQQPNH
jgi:hypothetical protein